MALSNREGEEMESQREDIIKLYITNKPTSFQGMSLPPLAEILSGKGDDETQSSKPLAEIEKWMVHCFRIRRPSELAC